LDQNGREKQPEYLCWLWGRCEPNAPIWVMKENGSVKKGEGGKKSYYEDDNGLQAPQSDCE